MKTSESIQDGRFALDGKESSTEKTNSKFWGIVLMTTIYLIVILVLALLIL